MAMVRKIDGRTMSGMVSQIESLSQHEETKSESQELEMHRQDVLVAMNFLKDRWVALSAEDKKTAIEALSKKYPPKTWHLAVRQMLLNDASAAYRSKQLWEKFEAACDPFAETEFDVFDLKLSGFDDVGANSKLGIFNRVYWKESMVTLISTGKSDAETVRSSCERMQKRFENFDPFESSELARDAMTGYGHCWRYLEVLTNPALGPTHQDNLDMNCCSLFRLHHLLS